MDNKENMIFSGGKWLKFGYSTGSCATAAAKAALLTLIDQKQINKIEIFLPSGEKALFDVEICNFTKKYAECSVVKKESDDPDVTAGLSIFAKVEFSEHKFSDDNIFLTGGRGVGIVTLPGLSVPVGEHAINPAPKKMIINNLLPFLKKDDHIKITISVPYGEELAEKTYNPKLGIKGGISIIGTTGKVIPMSESALKKSLALKLSILNAQGYDSCAFVFGNYGNDFLKLTYNINDTFIVTTSNFVGFMLEHACNYNLKNILICGHLGKIIKLAGGIFNTHSRVADARMHILTSYAAINNVNPDILKQIFNCKTTTQAHELLCKNNLQYIYSQITEDISKKCREYTFNKINIGIIIFENNRNILSESNNAHLILKELKQHE